MKKVRWYLIAGFIAGLAFVLYYFFPQYADPIVSWFKDKFYTIMGSQTLDENGLNFIKQHEGLRLTVYPDTGGLPTVGYGHLVLPQDNLKLGDSITEDRADSFLDSDTSESVSWVNSNVKPKLNQNQFNACVDVYYGIGVGQGGVTSEFWQLINNGDFEGAANFLWNPITQTGHYVEDAGGNVQPGLVTRRQQEAAMLTAV